MKNGWSKYLMPAVILLGVVSLALAFSGTANAAASRGSKIDIIHSDKGADQCKLYLDGIKSENGIKYSGFRFECKMDLQDQMLHIDDLISKPIFLAAGNKPGDDHYYFGDEVTAEEERKASARCSVDTDTLDDEEPKVICEFDLSSKIINLLKNPNVKIVVRVADGYYRAWWSPAMSKDDIIFNGVCSEQDQKLIQSCLDQKLQGLEMASTFYSDDSTAYRTVLDNYRIKEAPWYNPTAKDELGYLDLVISVPFQQDGIDDFIFLSDRVNSDQFKVDNIIRTKGCTVEDNAVVCEVRVIDRKDPLKGYKLKLLGYGGEFYWESKTIDPSKCSRRDGLVDHKLIDGLCTIKFELQEHPGSTQLPANTEQIRIDIDREQMEINPNP